MVNPEHNPAGDFGLRLDGTALNKADILYTYSTIGLYRRYYRGLIDENIAGQVTPDTAAAILESLDWCFFGGSWFNHAGQRSQGPVKIAFM